MTGEFNQRRILLLGLLGSGVAMVVAGCESAYREPPDWAESDAEPILRRKRVHMRRRPIMAQPKQNTWNLRPDGTGGGGGGNSGSGNSGGGTSSGGGPGGGNSGGGGGWSDRRLKTDIRAIGRSPSGLPIYAFRYIWGGPAYVGVMAQDLLESWPEAVIVTSSGYLMVDYHCLDVKMMSLADYEMSAQRCPGQHSSA